METSNTSYYEMQDGNANNLNDTPDNITTPWSFADTDKPRQLSRDKSIHATDEVFNSMSHLAAAMISVLGLVLLIAQSGSNAWKIVSFSIYGMSLIFLFICSTLHHAISSTDEVKSFYYDVCFVSLVFVWLVLMTLLFCKSCFQCMHERFTSYTYFFLYHIHTYVRFMQQTTFVKQNKHNI